FLYWIFYSFCLSLGKGEMLPPVIAAWTANLVFFCVGILTLMHAE
ncbi:MAG: LptF/LptG family permease, partial [Deltaproteobacteria bacterium]|nr:LptF/LptG family permease [Deltaproteobacteria bacterium]